MSTTRAGCGAKATGVLLAIILVVAGAVLEVPPLVAAAPPRIVAIGDIHGAFTALVEILQRAGLIDGESRWIGGSATLVQTGDMLDRGVEVRRVMDLLMSLQEQAAEQGGRVVVLLGNHEAMNLLWIGRDVNPEVYSRFVDERSEKRGRAAWRAWAKLIRRRAEALGMIAQFSDDAREQWLAQHPPGLIEYREALAPEGRYGRWLRSLPVGVRVGQLLFFHAGVSPAESAGDLEAVTERVRLDLAAFEAYRQYLLDRKLILPFFSIEEMQQAAAADLQARRSQLAEREEEPTPDEAEHLRRLEGFLEFQGGSLTAPEGPLWFRGFATWGDEEGLPQVEKILETHGASHLIVAHTPRPDRSIQTRFGGRLFLIDTGMLSSFFEGGRASALEFKDGRFTAIYGDGEVVELNSGEETVAGLRWRLER